jgi:lipoyl(octanoyl) transferase
VNACLTIDLGLVGYREASELQKRVVAARQAGAVPDVLLLSEYPHVITLGRNGRRANLLASEAVLRQKGVEYFETSRGGDITYHGPGQVVGYPIWNLGAIRRDVVWYVRMLEEAMIEATAEFGLAARREAGKTGVWVDTGDTSPAEKLAAIGVHVSRWVTSHGFAYNVATDLGYFDLIVPCGLAERKATSLEKLLGRQVGAGEVKAKLESSLGRVFGLEMRRVDRAELDERLKAAERALAVPA